MTLAPGTRLGPYQIRETLGRGGMGVVYRARDARLDREVAIKLLSAEASGDSERRRRFEREGRAVAQLNHPNILTVYDVGEHEGALYLVTELLDGEILRRRLERGSVPWATALRWTCQVADGLSAAHERRIVHRDLKPENIWITRDERAKILDFGIAKVVQSGSGAAEGTLAEPGAGLTEAGAIVGTAGYMSPEQVRGLPVDGRSDLFSLGAVLYEMVTGEMAFRGPTAMDVMSAILHGEPPPLRLPRGCPAGLARLVERCLAKEPEGRLSSGRDLAVALQALLESPVEGEPAAAALAPRLAVLPFADLSPGRDQGFLCEGIAEELIGALARLPGLKVAARSSAFRFQGGADLRRVGAELGVDKILEGSVRRSGDRLRIGIQLVNVADGYQLWSERYDRDLEDIFALQDEIAVRVVAALSPQLAARATPRAKRYTENLEAYQLYLKGRYLWNKRHEGGLREGLEAFEAAIDKDPLYAPAYGGLADSYALLGSWFDVLPAAEAMPKAKAAARRALEIDEALPEAYAALGWVALHYDWDWEAAETDFRRSLELDAGRAATRHWYSFFLSAMGRAEEAEREARAAWELDPLGLIINANLAQPLYYARRFEDALAEAGKLVRMEPAFPIAYQWLGMTLAALGRWDEAIREIEVYGAAYPDSTRSRAFVGYLQGRAGQREAALRCLGELRAAPADRLRAIHLAFVHIGLGDSDAAFAALEQAHAERSDQLPYLAVDPVFDPLRGDPRFTALLERLGLPAATAL